MTYNWQQHDWPEFKYRTDGIEADLYTFAEKTGRVSGALQGLREEEQTELVVELMVSEAIKTSEIEGEFFSRKDVRSSIRNQLGLNPAIETVRDPRARGVAELMVHVRNTFSEPLREADLFQWHDMLMAGAKRIAVGRWRDHAEPMQIVSGPFGKEKVHYEAPPSNDVPRQMAEYIKWFNDTAPGGTNEIKLAPVRSAIAHIYFESIHPFEDGNGRIGRALSEKALAQGLGRPVLLSLSEVIEQKRHDYYEALKTGQRSNEVTAWVEYFVQTILEAQERAESLVSFVIEKAKFFDQYRDALNERQAKVVRRMLDEGFDGFEGGMSARKYVSITGASKATATRDLQYLSEIGAFLPSGGGRSVRYQLNIPPIG
ncbi:Fic family protein [Hyphobacterium marinum]|uniref:Fic family protein n=1 Tax=Hyphobacterium marinum TaxID=3116574 RepID=A0ABU7LXL5_9PROT|nr:Fic family protein [Hyphobacterium sp. Y6023]MEE2566303.1 Fic family protein [Hyphobacterium sp. Y6023]